MIYSIKKSFTDNDEGNKMQTLNDDKEKSVENVAEKTYICMKKLIKEKKVKLYLNTQSIFISIKNK